ncbi:MAG TPA: UDP-N-acetylenolpyruvoylglucosamine reductase, partial [Ruminococcaceae bacterium]|nr:UDP-N-acetylenolpyruvoylglucosamine reductase [Oscillospiraceae bacterium]
KLEQGDQAAIKEKMDDVMDRRKSKQPLEFPSAGSVFKRPKDAFAGTLIEQCGLKGKTVGGAQVSEKHAGFIINIGGATCDDVMGLVKLVQDTVKAETGYSLEREIIRIGRE